MNVRIFFKYGGYTEVLVYSLSELESKYGYGLNEISRLEVL
ncbi:hypothetical protein HOBO_219 [Bacillus phage Hobo]|uniref:Uncharacterized protein n=2 Tax=Caeruleovirus BM15 TaxID=1985178 RepID=A0A0S2MUV5_9CAUD|nr:hypothetical protein FD732_gp122 [Bacillus phage BM15]ALO79627.1 hypothetical protein BM10_223 [Bacillus phage BM15]AXQ66974.1 hypothetical protein HOBO_219 [Bacillus phage Hobo]